VKKSASRIKALERIRKNIERHSFHVYLVEGGPSPAFAYTIGLSEKLGFELIIAGLSIFTTCKLMSHLQQAAKSALSSGATDQLESDFEFRAVHETWQTRLLLGANDYYGKQSVPSVQLVPRSLGLRTIDTPDLSAEFLVGWNAWRWLDHAWDFPVPQDSSAVTDLDCLSGSLATRVVRWEEDQWEIFSKNGEDIDPDRMREVPLGTLLAHDQSLWMASRLEVGQGIFREESDSSWRLWK
jgi:hypothetical protein